MRRVAGARLLTAAAWTGEAAVLAVLAIVALTSMLGGDRPSTTAPPSPRPCTLWSGPTYERADGAILIVTRDAFGVFEYSHLEQRWTLQVEDELTNQELHEPWACGLLDAAGSGGCGRVSVRRPEDVWAQRSTEAQMEQSLSRLEREISRLPPEERARLRRQLRDRRNEMRRGIYRPMTQEERWEVRDHWHRAPHPRVFAVLGDPGPSSPRNLFPKEESWAKAARAPYVEELTASGLPAVEARR